MKYTKKYFLTLGQARKLFKKRPKQIFLYPGIKKGSFGIVFGVSKGGKTIWAENLAMALALGKESYMGEKLPGAPMKVIVVGLEEYWENRVERNLKQLSTYSSEEVELLETNYMIQPIEFSKYLTTSKDWESLVNTIKASEAEVVIIDSITRMNHGNLEDSKTAEEIMQKLRDIAYELKITLICIHHTPKMLDLPITMDKIKGSAVFAQESDFAIGINRTSKSFRYQKDVFFRYASDDTETVREFKIDESTRIIHIENTSETDILVRGDRRRMDDHKTKILEYFSKYSCTEHQTTELTKILTSMLPLKSRRIKQLLSEMVKDKKINSPKRGVYKSIECIEKEVSNEEE